MIKAGIAGSTAYTGAERLRLLARPRGETQGDLVKGASGQAVQNSNIKFGPPETLGLELVVNVP